MEISCFATPHRKEQDGNGQAIGLDKPGPDKETGWGTMGASGKLSATAEGTLNAGMPGKPELLSKELQPINGSTAPLQFRRDYKRATQPLLS